DEVDSEVPDVVQVPRNEISLEIVYEELSRARTDLVFKPGLSLRVFRVAQSGSYVVEGLREQLARLFVLEEKRVRVQVVALIELAPEAAYVADFEEHLPRQLALNREVDLVISRIEELGVVQEREQLGKPVPGYDRRRGRRVLRHRNVSVDSRPERLSR